MDYMLFASVIDRFFLFDKRPIISLLSNENQIKILRGDLKRVVRIFGSLPFGDVTTNNVFGLD